MEVSIFVLFAFLLRNTSWFSLSLIKKIFRNLVSLRSLLFVALLQTQAIADISTLFIGLRIGLANFIVSLTRAPFGKLSVLLYHRKMCCEIFFFAFLFSNDKDKRRNREKSRNLSSHRDISFQTFYFDKITFGFRNILKLNREDSIFLSRFTFQLQNFATNLKEKCWKRYILQR